MPNLLVELGTEEIPAFYIEPALNAWREAVVTALAEARVAVGDVRVDATPRRLVLFAHDVAETSPDAVEDVKGPQKDKAFDAAGKPTKALEGFLASRGVSLDDIRFETVTVGKGKKAQTAEQVVATVRIPGRPATEILPDLIRDSLGRIPFPKTMRWGQKLDAQREWEFPRPVRYVVCLFGSETVPLNIPGLSVGRDTEGHPFLSGQENSDFRGEKIRIGAADMEEFKTKLESAGNVILSTRRRREMIEHALEAEMEKRGVTIDPADFAKLLPEVANLVEWPGIVVGQFKPEFLDLPDEVLRASMMNHQRYFPLKSPADEQLGSGEFAGPATKLATKGPGQLVNAFAAVINRKRDMNNIIARGNERVLQARLSDAKFFWHDDRKRPLGAFAPRLADLVYHDAFGSFGDKTARLVALAEPFGQKLGLDAGERKALERAAELSKADLVTSMVFEFPELQGVMGGHYARHADESEAVATAIGEHYRPVGREDQLPASRVGAVLSLIDKFDALAGYFIIREDEKPGDRHGLRRQTIGIVRILESRPEFSESVAVLFDIAAKGYSVFTQKNRKTNQSERVPVTDDLRRQALDRFMGFFRDRLENFSRDYGYHHDHIQAAVHAGIGVGNVADFFARLAAVKALSQRPHWDGLLELAERTANITKNVSVEDLLPEPKAKLIADEPERKLYESYVETKPAVESALAKTDFIAAAEIYRDALAVVTHHFFDHVMVMVDDPELRQNRLTLLRRVYELLGTRFAALDRVPRQRPDTTTTTTTAAH